jgi:Flp pilus assembly protein protease CpaA
MLSLGLLIKHSTLLLVVLERLVVVLLLLLALLALRSRRTEGCAGDNSRAGRLL